MALSAVPPGDASRGQNANVLQGEHTADLCAQMCFPFYAEVNFKILYAFGKANLPFLRFPYSYGSFSPVDRCRYIKPL